MISDGFFIHLITDLIDIFPVQVQEHTKKKTEKIEARKTGLLT